MAYTATQACNLALSKIADESAQITSLPATASEEYSKEANLCSKFYEPTLKELLRLHEWKCAKKRAALALDSESPVFGWTYSHSIPADCERIISVHPTDSTQRTFRYNTEWVVEQGHILSNSEDLWIVYIQNMGNLSTADSLFFRALYTLLATKLVFPLTENRNLTKDIINEFEQIVMPEARRIDSYAGNEYATIDSAWIEAGYNGFSGNPVQNFDINESGYGTI